MTTKKNNIFRNPAILQYLTVVIPAIYILLGFYFRQVFGDLSLRSNDPEYIHFISGMCISTGQFDQANIDHPGSVLQIILAIVFRVVYFFRQGDLPYFEDAMINSDLYLSVGNLVISLLISLSLLWAGKRTFKITGNIFYAILIQVSPLLINVWYEIIGRIYPELLILIPVLIIQVQLLKMIYSPSEKSSWKDILVFSFAIACGMSLKMTFLPFVLVPLIVLRKWIDKLKFVGFSAIFFLLLSLPVTFQMEKFWNWMKGIFLHSGSYQSGNKNIIDFDLFFNNLSNILKNEWAFYTAGAILVICIVLFIFIRRNQKENRQVLIRITLSLLLVFAGMTFIISKQFAIRYFLPALLFFPFLLMLILENVSSIFNIKKIYLTIASILILGIGINLLIKEVPYIRIVSKSISSQMAARESTRNVIGTLEKNSYKIIVSQDYGCPFHEYAIMHSFCVAGGGWPNYKEKLNNIYPDTYQYFTWDNTIKYWGQDFNPDEIIKSGKPVYLYLQKNSEELYKKTLEKLFGTSGDFTIEKKLIFQNPENEEGILQLYISRSEENNLETNSEEL